MTAWEYLILDCQMVGSHVHPRFQNGEELPNWQKLRLSEVVNRLGAEGWELVQFSQAPPLTAGSPVAGAETWVFKRRKASETAQAR